MNKNLQKLTISAMMIALSVVLSLFAVFKLPNGGSVTIASMVPIIIIGYLYDTKWALLTAFVFSLTQMVTGGGVSAPPVQNFLYYALVVLLDYVIAFTVLGLSGLFAKAFKNNQTFGYAFGAFAAVFCRFLCHFLSGIIIWGVYAPEGQSAVLYSLTYNGSYMGVEAIITVAVVLALTPFVKSYLKKQTSTN